MPFLRFLSSRLQGIMIISQNINFHHTVANCMTDCLTDGRFGLDKKTKLRFVKVITQNHISPYQHDSVLGMCCNEIINCRNTQLTESDPNRVKTWFLCSNILYYMSIWKLSFKYINYIIYTNYDFEIIYVLLNNLIFMK